MTQTGPTFYFCFVFVVGGGVGNEFSLRVWLRVWQMNPQMFRSHRLHNSHFPHAKSMQKLPQMRLHTFPTCFEPFLTKHVKQNAQTRHIINVLFWDMNWKKAKFAALSWIEAWLVLLASKLTPSPSASILPTPRAVGSLCMGRRLQLLEQHTWRPHIYIIWD